MLPNAQQALSRASAPARGTRPPHRRSLIVAAASDLFSRHGYERVSMSDIADAVNVRPSAIYRHFPSKNAVLDEAVTAMILRLRSGADEITSTRLDDVLRSLSAAYLDNRCFAQLWVREIRHLPAIRQQELRRLGSRIVQIVVERICGARPALTGHQADLLAWCVLNAFISVALHDLDLPRREFETLLSGIARDILEVDPLESGAVPVDQDTDAMLELRPRREAVLNAAMELFARHGYTSVTLDDIGEAAGITGATVYNYFASKQQVLRALVVRAAEWLKMSLHVAMRGARTHEDALHRLTEAFIRFALEHRGLLALLSQEIGLPEEERLAADRAYRDVVDEWADLLREIRPDQTPTVSRIRVRAVMNLAYGVAGSRHLRRLPGVAQSLHRACAAALGLPSAACAVHGDGSGHRG